MNKTIITVVVVAVLAVGAYVAMQSKSNNSDDEKKLDSSKQTSETFDPKNPNFIMGTVSAVSATKIDFAEGANNYSAQISAETKLVKQAKDGKTIKIVDATLADFKDKQQIVVYFSDPPKAGVYQADKIQIIGQ
ncbi:MAG: hypothetical protein A3J07_02125 [Candidatus Doudnabacteria bacterium RIFCSPLOWO2_02_FULL_49_13]|uniref:DUF5666 domain-containing protein n=1 Tax=Candidatus Doudnabacteria bacterium RIFCSPHIGHO2_12_FULL_48_16 TaxID=1817838 RepID=A0A1F5PLF0_9BACT|nr:MAG: hypothetical protein A3B77_00585 [Candidatus Doudnabacteria bacterium RIFCSPHIGHO2_02_FULL_49_24]OGE89669.1 MAG: hypothetical protein A2760_00695 [Candidatus Doudnabacteria bacterium RIFCSPHIGHO2_01_FULL_50_67]OGE90731.1 MAG: hypothetical protein A3E29_01225 [Candidatus Doudnabacteria bacterium RIFCSPHIGHO2_12_FULL_48_16]OGE96842.1 MAG: hypothetical protein A2990_03330 [Candidatus Doudnabacteria bacterium RIFCSPLOWO2_01_FULL_49_40]OGF02594.1 MAG: hypothetical protein A3J07_02125 [Candid